MTLLASVDTYGAIVLQHDGREQARLHADRPEVVGLLLGLYLVHVLSCLLAQPHTWIDSSVLEAQITLLIEHLLPILRPALGVWLLGRRGQLLKQLEVLRDSFGTLRQVKRHELSYLHCLHFYFLITLLQLLLEKLVFVHHFEHGFVEHLLLALEDALVSFFGLR